MNRRWTLIVSGALFYACITSLYQDIYGKGRYLAMVEDYWVDAWITVPLAIVVMILVVSIWHKDKKDHGAD